MSPDLGIGAAGRLQADSTGSLWAYTTAALPTIRLANAAGVSSASRGAKYCVSSSSSSVASARIWASTAYLESK